MRNACLSALAALVMALGVAPSAALGAPPNRLSQPAVSPASGTTLTAFSLAVRYRSRTGIAAGGVVASVAGLRLPLVLSSGTPTDGRWKGETLLPVGRWQVTFEATPPQGNQPSLAGPAIEVTNAGPASPAPAPSGGDSEQRAGTDGDAAEGATHPPQPAPAAASRSPGSSGEAATGAPTRGGEETSRPARQGPRDDRDGDDPRDGDAATGRRGDDGRFSPGARHRPPRGAGAAEVDATVEPQLDRGLAGAFGALGVAVAAALTLGWLVLRRRREREASAVVMVPADDSATDAADADGLLTRRALRRARLEAGDDPIIAALGLGGEPDHAAGDGRHSRGGGRPRP